MPGKMTVSRKVFGSLEDLLLKALTEEDGGIPKALRQSGRSSGKNWPGIMKASGWQLFGNPKDIHQISSHPECPCKVLSKKNNGEARNVLVAQLLEKVRITDHTRWYFL